MSNHPDNNPANVDAPLSAEYHARVSLGDSYIADAPPPRPARPIDKAIYILSVTRDGDDLSPHHLALLEAACNGNLTIDGEKSFEALFQNVLTGYVKPWYHDFEHLTQDLEGYIYWRNVQVEHYSFRDYTAAHVAATKLVDACLAIEARGETVNGANVLEELSTMRGTPADHPVVYRADSITDLRAALRGDV